MKKKKKYFSNNLTFNVKNDKNDEYMYVIIGIILIIIHKLHIIFFNLS